MRVTSITAPITLVRLRYRFQQTRQDRYMRLRSATRADVTGSLPQKPEYCKRCQDGLIMGQTTTVGNTLCHRATLTRP